MTTREWLEQVKQRLEAAKPRAHKRGGHTLDVLALGDLNDHAPQDLARCLAIIEIYGQALEEASEYSKRDDCNGVAGELAAEALRKAEEVCGE